MVSKFDQQTLNAIQSAIGLQATPVTIASGVRSGSEGSTAAATLAALNTLESFAAVAGKTLKGASPLLAGLSATNNLRQAWRETGSQDHIQDRTALSLLGDASALVGIAGAAFVGGTVGVGVLAAGTVAAAGLGIAALAQSDGDTEISEAATALLDQVQDLVRQGGDALTDAFASLGGTLDEGIGTLADGMAELGDTLASGYAASRSGLTDFFEDTGGIQGILGSAADFWTGGLIDTLQALFGEAEGVASPLVLDLDGDGVETLGLDGAVHFDHDGNGFAELTGWAHGDDGLLVLDRNGNGLIDHGSELFGNQTPTGAGTAANGFAALAALDTNGDGAVDPSDEAWSELRVWRDLNHDGVSQTNELFTLDEADVAAIGVGYSDAGHVDAQGNAHRQVGSFTRADGSTGAATDVWFAADTARTVDRNGITPSDEILALPQLGGLGNVPSLRQAMARDGSGSLQSLVEQFAAEPDAATRESLLRDLVFQWTGVADVDPASRGGYMDARELGALENLLGRPFLQGSSPDPRTDAASLLKTAFEDFMERVSGRLMAQTHLKPMYDSIELQANHTTSEVELDLTGTVALMEAEYAIHPAETVARMGDFFAGLKGMGPSGAAIVEQLRSMGDITATGFAFQLAIVGYFEGVQGDERDNSLYAPSHRDSMLHGLQGDDYLSGGGGDDLLNGGEGNDSLYGNEGSDTYVFNPGDGADTIYEYDYGNRYTDRIAFGEGIAQDHLRLLADGQDLLIDVGSTGDSMRIQEWFNADYYRLDLFEFADGTLLDRAGLLELGVHLEGDDAANILYAPNSTPVTLHGHGGDDTLNGSNHDDTLIGGTGDDYLAGDLGNDTYVFNLGDGSDTVYEYDYGNAYTDRMVFGDGIAQDHLRLLADGRDLLIEVGSAGDSMRIQDWFNADYYRLDLFEFADGTLLDRAGLLELGVHLEGDDAANTLYAPNSTPVTLHGHGGNDSLNGSNRDDTLIGGAGDDYLAGDKGNDTYVFNPGDGADTIYEYDYGNVYTDRMVFGEGIAHDQLWFSRAGNHLVISKIGEEQSVTVQDWYYGNAYHIDEIATGDGMALLDSQVQQLVDAMATFSPPAGGESHLSPELREELQPVIAASWQSAA